MTGYGRAKKTLSNRDITVEVRSVNNRYLDCTVKLPRAYIFAEDAIKGRVQKAISRGKVDVFVTIDSTGADEEVVVVNEGLARSYLEALRKLYEIDGGNYLQKQSYAADLARIPDVLTVTKAEEDLESVGADICEVLDEALASYNRMRATEGQKLAEDIGGRLTTIETLTGKVEERSPETVREYREKLTARMQEVLQSTTIDESRILTEAAIYADKIAVDERPCVCARMCRSCATCCSPTNPWAARWTFSFRRSTARATPSARSATTSPSRAMWSRSRRRSKRSASRCRTSSKGRSK